MTSSKVKKELVDFKFNVNSSDGFRYQRLLAIHLAQKAFFKNRIFKLAFEMTAAEKFDDVVFYLKDSDEWLFIQVKHCQNNENVTAAMLDKTDDGDFSLLKYLESYCKIQDFMNPYEGRKKRFVIFTTRGVSKTLIGSCENVPVDTILDFWKDSSHNQLIPNSKKIISLSETTSTKFKELFNAIDSVVSNGRLSEIILDYRTPLRRFFRLAGEEVTLIDTLFEEDNNRKTRKLFDLLKHKFKGGSKIAKTHMDKIFAGESRQKYLPPVADQETVKQFFNDLILSVSQPKIDDLLTIIDEGMLVWMKGWIPPDDLGTLTQNQIELPRQKIENLFECWYKEQEATNGGHKKLITEQDTQKWMKSIENELNETIDQKHKRSCASLKVIENYYIERRISCSSKGNKSNKQIFNQIVFDEISETKFIEQLFTKFQHQQCFILIAEPGMGKSALWQNMAYYAQRKYTNKFVFLIYLNNFRDELATLKTIDDVLKVFGSYVSTANHKYLKNEDTEVILFLDAFDELLPENMDVFTSAMNILLEKKKLKLFVSGRQRVQENLEKSLSVEALSVLPLSDEDQQNFLIRFWISHGILSDNIEEISKLFLTKFNKGILSKQFEFLGKPLLIRMLADIYLDSIKDIISTDCGMETVFDDHLTIVDIYDTFINKSLRETYTKINNIPFESTIPRTGTHSVKNWRHSYQLIALEDQVPKKLLDLIVDEDFKTEVTEIRQEIINHKDETLIIEVVNNCARFTHLSYSEYLVARYIFEYIGKTEKSKCWNKINTYLKRAEVVRIFIFEMINSENFEKSKPTKEGMQRLEFVRMIGKRGAFWACEGNCCNLLKYLQTFYDYNTIRDPDRDSNPSMIHRAIYCKAYQALQLLLDVPCDPNIMDAFEHPPLFSTIDNLNIMKLLASYGAKFEQNTNHMLLCAVNYGSFDTVQYLIEKNFQVNMPSSYDGKTPLHLAAERNRFDVFKLLVSNGACLESIDKYTNTILHVAAKSGSKEMIQFIIANSKQNIDTQNDFGQTPLHIAAEAQRDEIIKLLVLKQADIKLNNCYGNNTLHYIASYGSSELFEYLIERGAELNSTNNKDETPFYIASKRNDLDLLKVLVDKGANIVDSGCVTLRNAAKFGFTKIVEYLIELSVDINSKNRLNETPLNYAVYGKQEETIKLLIRKNAQFEKVGFTGDTILHCVVPFGTRELIEFIIDNGIDIDIQNKYGQTSLHLAAFQGSKVVVSLFISKGANIHSVDKQGNNVLHYAAKEGSLDLIEYLFEKNVDFDLPNSEGKTPLYYAIFRYEGIREESIKFLINAGASTETVYNINNTILHRVVRQGSTEYIGYLLGKGLKINERNKFGETPLHKAVVRNDISLLSYLIDAGANVHELDYQNNSILHFAARYASTLILAYFIQLGVDVNSQNLDGETPLYRAIEIKDAENVTFLLNKGADVHLSAKHDTILHYAILKGTKEMIKQIIDKGVDKNILDSDNKTPRDLAKQHKRKHIWKILVSIDANTNSEDYCYSDSTFDSDCDFDLDSDLDSNHSFDYESSQCDYFAGDVGSDSDIVEQTCSTETDTLRRNFREYPRKNIRYPRSST